MSSNSFDSGPPSPKRFKSDNNVPFSQDYSSKSPIQYSSNSNDLFGSYDATTTARRFTTTTTTTTVSSAHCNNSNISVEGRYQEGSRHLFSSPPYATAAVTNTNDTELLSNGDSGFQELNIPDELSISDNGAIKDNNNSIKIVDGNDVNEDDNNIENGDSRDDLQNVSLVANHSKSSNSDDDSISEFSYSSEFSSLSGENLIPINNNIEWIQRQLSNGLGPKDIIQLIGDDILTDLDDRLRLVFSILSEPPLRSKLSNINTIEDVIDLIQSSSKIIVLTGAGVSVSCGIPDFRSRNGIYARLSKDYPDLPDPQSMFDIRYFKKNPYPFFKFAKEIYPGQFQPSASHKFIKFIEMKGKLLRNYSQNIDTLEKTAGIENVITCHGSFATASCTVCGYKVDSQAIQSDIFAQKIPLCPRCTPQTTPSSSLLPSSSDNPQHHHDQQQPMTNDNILPVMKPDIVFFGEGLSDEFHNSMIIDKEECDLLIVIGSSLKVHPVAYIPSSIPETVPQILINREPLNHLNFDVELLGDCDVIVKDLCKRLGNDWSEYCFPGEENLSESKQNESKNGTAEQANGDIDNNDEDECVQFIPPCRYIFKGAEINDIYDDSKDDSDSDDDDDDGDEEDEADAEDEEQQEQEDEENDQLDQSNDDDQNDSSMEQQHLNGISKHQQLNDKINDESSPSPMDEIIHLPKIQDPHFLSYPNDLSNDTKNTDDHHRQTTNETN